MTYAGTTTLARIRAAQPCEPGWQKLLKYLGKTQADNEPLPLLTVLDSNGLDDALWVLTYAMPDDRLERHFQAWCAQEVVHLFEAVRPGDTRVRDQIKILRNDDATPEMRKAARDAAWVAARSGAAATARAAVWDTAWAGAAAAAWTRSAAAAAAWARRAAGSETENSARAAQEAQLRAMLDRKEGQ